MVSCADGATGPLIQLERTRSINGSYVIESLTVDGVELDVDSGRPITLNLNAVDRTDVNGNGPCNDFFGGCSHHQGKLVITGWATTDLERPSREAIQVETALFEALKEPIDTTIDLDQTPPQLIMTDEDATIIWTETTPPESQPTIPHPFDRTTTTVPGGPDPGVVDVSARRDRA